MISYFECLQHLYGRADTDTPGRIQRIAEGRVDRFVGGERRGGGDVTKAEGTVRGRHEQACRSGRDIYCRGRLAGSSSGGRRWTLLVLDSVTLLLIPPSSAAPFPASSSSSEPVTLVLLLLEPLVLRSALHRGKAICLLLVLREP